MTKLKEYTGKVVRGIAARLYAKYPDISIDMTMLSDGLVWIKTVGIINKVDPDIVVFDDEQFMEEAVRIAKIETGFDDDKIAHYLEMFKTLPEEVKSEAIDDCKQIVNVYRVIKAGTLNPVPISDE